MVAGNVPRIGAPILPAPTVFADGGSTRNTRSSFLQETAQSDNRTTSSRRAYCKQGTMRSLRFFSLGLKDLLCFFQFTPPRGREALASAVDEELDHANGRADAFGAD